MAKQRSKKGMKRSTKTLLLSFLFVFGVIITLLIITKGNGALLNNLFGSDKTFIGNSNQRVLVDHDGNVVKDEPKKKEEVSTSPTRNTGRRRSYGPNIVVLQQESSSSDESTNLKKSMNYTDERVGEVKEELGEFKVETNGNFKKTNDNINDVKDMLRKKEEGPKYKRDDGDDYNDNESSPRMFE